VGAQRAARRVGNNYCWDAGEGRATTSGGGERLVLLLQLEVAGQVAERRGVIVSARHERSPQRRGARWAGVGEDGDEEMGGCCGGRIVVGNHLKA
jgi:hypothetical protein